MSERKFTPEELAEARAWRREQRRLREQTPEGRREVLKRRAADLVAWALLAIMAAAYFLLVK